MPRLLINGFPETTHCCFHIRVNAGAKGSGSQHKLLFDKTITPMNGIYEIPLENNYLGATIRLEVSIPGFLVVDTNIHVHTNKGYTSLRLTKQQQPDIEQINACYISTQAWQSINCRELYNQSKLQFKKTYCC